MSSFLYIEVCIKNIVCISDFFKAMFTFRTTPFYALTRYVTF